MFFFCLLLVGLLLPRLFCWLKSSSWVSNVEMFYLLSIHFHQNFEVFFYIVMYYVSEPFIELIGFGQRNNIKWCFIDFLLGPILSVDHFIVFLFDMALQLLIVWLIISFFFQQPASSKLKAANQDSPPKRSQEVLHSHNIVS